MVDRLAGRQFHLLACTAGPGLQAACWLTVNDICHFWICLPQERRTAEAAALERDAATAQTAAARLESLHQQVGSSHSLTGLHTSQAWTLWLCHLYSSGLICCIPACVAAWGLSSGHSVMLCTAAIPVVHVLFSLYCSLIPSPLQLQLFGCINRCTGQSRWPLIPQVKEVGTQLAELRHEQETSRQQLQEAQHALRMVQGESAAAQVRAAITGPPSFPQCSNRLHVLQGAMPSLRMQYENTLPACARNPLCFCDALGIWPHMPVSISSHQLLYDEPQL